ncbi:chaperone modulator CbpM [Dysgonomonas macrotermitis]|uniref:MerR HTH family regulatory protein n=1 Tax=Dysgonomonas macrotermitis TaxID=1346286 RepID=A0A1M4ZL14_9BACT|nr:chaperone modulator CbpM [Dysgonomonas macrotermitis]SHF18749.1 MerR HTH family regulatory protein [Dysgonomonas macrotermitis]
METGLIIIEEYCRNSRIESSFVSLLAREGLIDIKVVEETMYIHESQLADLDRFANMYYDLSINIEGIDVIHNLLQRINGLEKELYSLRKLFGHKDDLWEDIE